MKRCCVCLAYRNKCSAGLELEGGWARLNGQQAAAQSCGGHAISKFPMPHHLGNFANFSGLSDALIPGASHTHDKHIIALSGCLKIKTMTLQPSHHSPVELSSYVLLVQKQWHWTQAFIWPSHSVLKSLEVLFGGLQGLWLIYRVRFVSNMCT